MSLSDLLLILAPALLVVAAAVRVAVRERAGRDLVLDLRDVPAVLLATRAGPIPDIAHGAPLEGALVDPGGAGTLGARLRSTVAVPASGCEEPAPAGHAPRVVLVRRRRRPLVALSREPTPR